MNFPFVGETITKNTPREYYGERCKEALPNSKLQLSMYPLVTFIDRQHEEALRIPDKLLISVNNNPEKINNLEGFKITADSHSRLKTIIFQAGDYIGITMIPEIASKLRDDVEIIVLAGNNRVAHFVLNGLKKHNLKNLEQRLRFIVGGSLSSWGRDPYIVLVNPKNKKFTLLPAKGDAGTRNDRGVAQEIMRRDIDGIVTYENKNSLLNRTLDLQGGDVTSDHEYVYVGEETVHYCRFNIASMAMYTENEAIAQIEKVTGKKVIVLRGVQDIHNDRYHMPLDKTNLGEHTSLLIDPLEALEILSNLTPDERKQTIEKILASIEGTPLAESEEYKRDRIAEFLLVTKNDIKEAKKSPLVQALSELEKYLQKQGIKVIRIPGLPKDFANNPFGIYPTNVIIDGSSLGDVKPSVIVPHYNISTLDKKIDQVFDSVGFKIFPVTAILAGEGEGGLRCLAQTVAIPL
ncbi:MAG: hypothetical protein ABIH71_06695 [Candidatus Omnitrophota bacterium]